MTTGCQKKLGNIDLSNIIRNIDWEMSYDEIVELEGEAKDYEPTEDYTIIEYENAKFNDYNGKIIYRFDKNDKLDFIKFQFYEKDDYEEYMMSFVGQYGKWDEEDKDIYLKAWNGYVNTSYASFSTFEDAYMIVISK